MNADQPKQLETDLLSDAELGVIKRVAGSILDKREPGKIRHEMDVVIEREKVRRIRNDIVSCIQ